MPSERVTDLAELFDVKVSWGPGRDVQVGIESYSSATRPSTSLVDWLLGMSSNRAAAQALRSQLVDLLGDEPASFTGLWSSLDRAGINRLIRLLQRARDSAFGPDA